MNPQTVLAFNNIFLSIIPLAKDKGDFRETDKQTILQKIREKVDSATGSFIYSQRGNFQILSIVRLR